ncbi:hypothetical protein K438DRAFT_1761882 [Mycena galopus ATCC 62051]|nr:hypothetical protein K438DRAFT_1761882 [Mycena galopus ATCC 62051]
MTIIPQELLEAIVHEVDEKDSLKACALASRDLLQWIYEGTLLRTPHVWQMKLGTSAKNADIHNLETPFLAAIANTTQSLNVKQNRNECIQLMEQTHELLNAIIIVHIKSDTGGELPPNKLSNIRKFTETIHKIYTFVEAQQNSNTVKMFFRRGEMDTLLKDCKAGVQNGLECFQIEAVMAGIAQMKEATHNRHQEVLNMIEALSDAHSSDRASSMNKVYSTSHNSSHSISMLPSEPQIFHGRASELSEILNLFSQGTPRIAVLGAGGMGKTSLARTVLHHTKITTTYEQHRFFVASDTATTKVELAALVGAHLGLKPGKDLTQAVVQHFSYNLETLWEPAESRHDIEEFLSLLTDVDHLALMLTPCQITMRGAERPAKVAWTQPFLSPLKPLDQEAARCTFIDIADNGHRPEEVDQVLSLTDNMPLAISLLAHLADSEGCTNVLLRWEEEKTTLISEGFDKRSNLDLSISLSLSSPRIESLPHSRELLSLLSMLPDGLSDVELVQSNLPVDNILGCKAALIHTSLAYSDEQKRLKALVPIREYVKKTQPPGNHLIWPLLKYFQELLEFFVECIGTQPSSGTAARILSNYSNIQSIIWNGLQQDHPDLVDIIHSICHLNQFSQFIGQGAISLIGHIHSMLPQLHDHQLEAYFITELFNSQRNYPISNPETLVAQYLKHFEQVDDMDLKCSFYLSIANHYQVHKHDPFSAIKFCQTAISLATSTGNTKEHSRGLFNLARLNFLLGDYSAAQIYAHESQRLARISANFLREAHAINIEAMCLSALGDYKQSIALNVRARDLIGLCGASGGQLDYGIMVQQAEVHKNKSEYVEARNIHSSLLEEVSIHQVPFQHAFALLNIAEIDVSIGAPKQNVQRNIQTATKLFNGRLQVMMCDIVLADLHLREGNMLAAEDLLVKYIKSSLGHDNGIMSYCLERLGDVSRWKVPDRSSSWTTVYFVHSLKFKEKLGVYKALKFLGDIFFAFNDEETAISLFTVALEGFTQMDVHCSRAECMLHLGDISKGQSDLVRAVELWEAARPLFERSSQAKQIENIDGRLASVGDVLEQHRKNLAHLGELNAVGNGLSRVALDSPPLCHIHVHSFPSYHLVYLPLDSVAYASFYSLLHPVPPYLSARYISLLAATSRVPVAFLTNAPSGNVEELEDELSDVEDPEVDLDEAQDLAI